MTCMSDSSSAPFSGGQKVECRYIRTLKDDDDDMCMYIYIYIDFTRALIISIVLMFILSFCFVIILQYSKDS